MRATHSDRERKKGYARAYPFFVCSFFGVQVSAQAGQGLFSIPYVSETYDCFHFWNAIPWSLLSFFSKEEWKAAKEEVAGRTKKDLSAGRPAAQFVIPAVKQG